MDKTSSEKIIEKGIIGDIGAANKREASTTT
jgi:hypothetical protein